ncbi:MAG: hypothetical protein CEN90_4 [Parcubacteria group bacterium Licking1014_17]|nr:MAG: hypothetical protein CEN90_4 [Parcubacteria group bacterium Licking1014_17]
MSNEVLNIKIKKVVADLLGVLSARNKDVISRRFGLKTGRKETLESIGETYGITRERVRQIEESSLNQVRAQLSSLKSSMTPFASFAADVLNKSQGVTREEDLFEKFSGTAKPSPASASLSFVLYLDGNLKRYTEDDDFQSFWSVSEQHVENFKKSVAGLISVLNSKKIPVVEAEAANLLKKSAAPLKDGNILTSILAISKNVGKNVFGEVGLNDWAEIRPRGVRDKSFLVLKREGKPKHFREIAQLINSSSFSNKKANVQTVHNELIKDKRFVLVGRGMYGLTDWGYKTGTVKDVIVDVLKNSKNPLPKDEIVAQVLSHRMVKKNTILLNLQDSKTFAKKENGTYSLREA